MKTLRYTRHLKTADWRRFVPDSSKAHDQFNSIPEGKLPILALIISAALLLVESKIRVSCYRSRQGAEVNLMDAE
jgi:hypothetical protein